MLRCGSCYGRRCASFIPDAQGGLVSTIRKKRKIAVVDNNGETLLEYTIDRDPAKAKPFTADPAWTTHRPQLASYDPIQPDPLPPTGPQVASMMGMGNRAGTELFPHQVARVLGIKDDS